MSFPLVVPSLRDRVDDISLLTQHFLKEFSVIHGRKIRNLTAEAISVLRAYSWPGNVRELKNLIERVVILTLESEEGQPITAAHLLSHFQDEPERRPTGALSYRNLRDARQEFEREFILKTLKEYDWNVSKLPIF